MKLEVYDEKKEDVDVLRLKLVPSNGDVLLIAVDEDGNSISTGTILEIQENGMLRLVSNISVSLGLELDNKQRIKIDK